MASRKEFMEYVADQIRDAGNITYRKMFGEYGIYCDGKIFALVCDDMLYMKITKAGSNFAPALPKAPPYDGAKDYFLIEDIDNRDFLTQLTRITCDALPNKK